MAVIAAPWEDDNGKGARKINGCHLTRPRAGPARARLPARLPAATEVGYKVGILGWSKNGLFEVGGAAADPLE